jgi:hypothetical protein
MVKKVKKKLILALVVAFLIISNTTTMLGEEFEHRVSQSLPDGKSSNNQLLTPASFAYSIENKSRIYWSPQAFTYQPIHVPLNSIDTVFLTIENMGTDTLYACISSEASWLNIEPDSATLTGGCCPLKVNLIITGGSEETFWVDSLRILSNDQAGNDDVYVPMHVIVSDVYVQAQFTILSNPNYHIYESNVGNLGHQNDYAGFFLHQDPNQPNFLYDGSPIIGFTSPDGDSLVGRYIFNEPYISPVTELSVDTLLGLKTIVVEAEFAPHTPQAPLPWHHQWWYWTIKMQDFIFYSEAPDNKNEQYILLRHMQLYYNPPPDWWEPKDSLPDITETYLGMALDIDAPSDSGSWNQAGTYDSTRRMTYIQEYLGNNNVNEKYRMAIAQRDTCYWVAHAWGSKLYCWPDPNTINPQNEYTPDSIAKPYAMHILRNDSTVYPYGGYDDPDLYKWMTLPGDSVQTDTLGNIPPTDYNIVTTGRIIPAQSFPPADTYSVAYALVISDEENMDKLNDCVDMIICGNVNRDNIVNITDAVYIINYLFRLGPEPWLYVGDCNADSMVTISDVVYLIGYLFKGASPPQCSAL